MDEVNNSNLKNVLENIFETTQTEPYSETIPIIKDSSCKSGLQSTKDFDYKIFKYPTKEDIIVEVADTVNLNVNTFDKNSKNKPINFAVVEYLLTNISSVFSQINSLDENNREENNPTISPIDTKSNSIINLNNSIVNGTYIQKDNGYEREKPRDNNIFMSELERLSESEVTDKILSVDGVISKVSDESLTEILNKNSNFVTSSFSDIFIYNKKIATNLIVGFQTATGKDISVSDTARQAAVKKLSLDEDISLEDISITEIAKDNAKILSYNKKNVLSITTSNSNYDKSVPMTNPNKPASKNILNLKEDEHYKVFAENEIRNFAVEEDISIKEISKNNAKSLSNDKSKFLSNKQKMMNFDKYLNEEYYKEIDGREGQILMTEDINKSKSGFQSATGSKLFVSTFALKEALKKVNDDIDKEGFKKVYINSNAKIAADSSNATEEQINQTLEPLDVSINNSTIQGNDSELENFSISHVGNYYFKNDSSGDTVTVNDSNQDFFTFSEQSRSAWNIPNPKSSLYKVCSSTPKKVLNGTGSPSSMNWSLTESERPGLLSNIRNSRKTSYLIKKLVKIQNQAEVNGDFTVTYKNCLDLEFVAKDFEVLKVGDDGFLTPDKDRKIKPEQFVKSFMKLNGVSPNLISKQWILNHYQLILWKLLTFKNYFSSCLSSDWVSPHHIMLQLKYRYDKEIDNSKRPALRMISEQDDSASRRLIVVVAAIEKKGSEISQVLVSDGWYCVPALFDKCLKDQIHKNRIKIGTKLITFNAVWSGFDGPFVLPCSSFTTSSGLKLHGNSTRRARNCELLGFQRISRPFPVSLGSLNALGGIASLLSVVINRVYPIQYMETLTIPNQETPLRLFRNQRAEHAAENDYEKLKENIISRTINSISSSFKKQKNGPVTEQETGEEILNWVNNSIDQENAEEELSNKQRENLRLYKEEKILNALDKDCPKRNVIGVGRLLVSGIHPFDVDSKKAAMLTIWKPSDELMGLLTEGTAVNIYSVLVNYSTSDIHSSIYNCKVSLKTTSTSRFEQNTFVHENLIEKIYQPRQLLSINDLCRFLSSHTLSCEVDCIGLVIGISKIHYETNDCWQIIVLNNSENQVDDIVTIKIWSGLKNHYLHDVVELGNYVKFTNLQYRRILKKHSPPNIPECHFSQFSNATYESKYKLFYKIRDEMMKKINQFLPKFEKYTEENLDKESFSKSMSSLSTSTPKRVSITRDHNQSNNSLSSSSSKRLGLSKKRRNVSHTSSSSLNKTGESEPVVVDRSPEISQPWWDIETNIADHVKTVHRNSSPENKKQKH